MYSRLDYFDKYHICISSGRAIYTVSIVLMLYVALDRAVSYLHIAIADLI